MRGHCRDFVSIVAADSRDHFVRQSRTALPSTRSKALGAKAVSWRSRRSTRSKSPATLRARRWIYFSITSKATPKPRNLRAAWCRASSASAPRSTSALSKPPRIGSLTRLAKVDLVILRMATYELVFCPDIPPTVSLDEAIEIGKRFGSDDSAPFINGVLDQVRARARNRAT